MSDSERIQIYHVIQELSLGGAARAMIATAKYSSRLGPYKHSVISLRAPGPAAIELAKQGGMDVIVPADRQALVKEVEKADIIHLNWWNNPDVYEFLKMELPAMRLLNWMHVAGDGAPQIITPKLIDFCDFALPCSPYTYEHKAIQSLPPEVRLAKTGMVYGASDFERIENVQPKAHSGFNIGYIGTVNFIKMHMNYVWMNAMVEIPDVKFIVCGSGIEKGLQKQAEHLGKGDRFDFRGHVEDIKSVLEVLDVYGYPLCPNTYAAAELNLQEVMYAGIPPVVFPYGGVKQLVIHDYTGLIVRSEQEYKQAIEYLYHHPEERKRIGVNAKEYARQIFGAENAAKKLNPIYERMLELPKRKRSWNPAAANVDVKETVSQKGTTNRMADIKGSMAFVESLGEHGHKFQVSIQSTDPAELLLAENEIAASDMLMFITGIVGYSFYYANDPYLHLWKGLILEKLTKHIDAMTDFTAAINLGLTHWRVAWYLARASEKAGRFSEAEQCARLVLKAVPEFGEAQELLKRIEQPAKAT
jgi:glycosyltransferase involved in cell wall biosynthesis